VAIELKSYRSRLMEKLTIPSEAAHYINAALKDSTEMFLESVKDVAQAHQMALVAKKSGVAREALYRSLSKHGNPTLDTLVSVLSVLGLEIAGVKDLVSTEGSKPASKVKVRIHSSPTVNPVGSRYPAIKPQNAGSGYAQDIIGYAATVAGPNINQYANLENSGLALYMPAEESLATIDHLIFEAKYGRGQDSSGSSRYQIQKD
jgi:probable addiction module antidote protein